ncbi:nucleotide-binding protein [Gluconacetobacter diazotrophicus]|uniref:nucleotide-binding protein n=1 Tax=Gluconacetobacter diazotrophicus TaxID=33996 RepID=UPI00119A2658|nr:P-loop NTPase [Gluconacetobacter diazotrophicus]TWB05632.1 MinD-like ATPase involved in chromosome partitioning or flagellar assembly [Gluconacetobacter diazotrophicus]
MGDKTKRLVLVVSGKGGVGKTTFSRLMTDLYRERNTKAAIFDADGQIGGLVRVYHAVGVQFYDLRQDAERVTLLNSIASDADVILHDLPGGSRFEISKIVDNGDGEQVDGFLDALRENGVSLTLVHVIDNEIESAQSVGQYLDSFGTDSVDHVAVLNMRESRDLKADFPYWFGFDVNGERRYGKGRDRLLAAGGIEVSMPGMQVGTRAKLNALNLKFSDCARYPELTITERTIASQFLRGFRKAVEPAAGFLGL